MRSGKKERGQAEKMKFGIENVMFKIEIMWREN